ncbi:MAG: hypothetical protein R2718_03335 [Solirubrobacterales bacterium]
MAPANRPFSYRRTKDDRVMIDWNGRRAAVLTGGRARRFLAAVEGADGRREQLEMARVTGNFKRGNER